MASRKIGAALAATVLALLAAPLSSSTAVAAVPQPFAQTATFAELSGTSSDALTPAVKAASTTRVTESAAAVNYGNESSVAFTAEVAGGVTEGETVEVKVGSGSASATCIAHLTGAGVGKCAIEQNDALSAAFASYGVSAHYAGDGSLEPSEGTIVGGLTVTAGRTFTTVSVSPGKLNYGSESPVAVTARVTAEGNAPLPGGETAHIELGSESCTAGLSGGAISTGTCDISTTPELLPGSYPISAEYGGDLNLSGSASSNSSALDVEGTATSFTIAFGKPASSPAKITFGSTITLEEAGLPPQAQGTVEFTSGSTKLCSFTLSGSTTSCATSSTLEVGSYSSVTAKFASTSDGYASSESTNTLSLTVEAIATPFTIQVNGAETAIIGFGSTVALTETGLPAQAHGTVAFTAGSTSLCTFSVPAEHSCPTLNTLEVGSYSPIKASFTPTGAGYAGSQSTNTLSLTVESISTPFQLQVNGTAAATVEFAKATALTETGLPVAAHGTVTFTTGSTTLCHFTVPAESSCETPETLPVGLYKVAAGFVATGSGYANAQSANTVSLTVEPAPTSFKITVNGSSSFTAHAGTSATLAEAELPSGAQGAVTFTSGATALCTAALPATSCATSSRLAVGSYPNIVATFNDSDGNYLNSSASASPSGSPVTLILERLTSAVTITSSPSPATPYTTVTLTAKVAAQTSSSLVPTGTITFKSGAHILGTGALDAGGVATLSTAAPGPGSYYASAAYGGDGAYAGADSPVIIQTVKETFSGLFGLTANYLDSSGAYRRLPPKRRTVVDGQLTEINRLLDLAGAKSSKSVLAATIYDADITVMEDEGLLKAPQAEALIKLANGLPAPKIVAVASLGRKLRGHAVAVGTLHPGGAELTLEQLTPPLGDTYRLIIRTRVQGRASTLLNRVLTIV